MMQIDFGIMKAPNFSDKYNSYKDLMFPNKFHTLNTIEVI
jgi:hypothetical protein